MLLHSGRVRKLICGPSPPPDFLDSRDTELAFLAILLKKTMARFTNIVTVLIIFLCSSGFCNLADGWKSADEEADPQLAARHPAVFARDNLHEALFSAPNNSKKGSPFLGERALDGPALLASWLGIRQLTCDDPNYFVCASASSPLTNPNTQLNISR